MSLSTPSNALISLCLSCVNMDSTVFRLHDIAFPSLRDRLGDATSPTDIATTLRNVAQNAGTWRKVSIVFEGVTNPAQAPNVVYSDERFHDEDVPTPGGVALQPIRGVENSYTTRGQLVNGFQGREIWECFPGECVCARNGLCYNKVDSFVF